MSNVCEIMCYSRELLFLNPFVKAYKTKKMKSLDWVGFGFGFGVFLHRHLWWAEPVLGARPALELSKGLRILMIGCGAQLRMAKPF